MTAKAAPKKKEAPASDDEPTPIKLVLNRDRDILFHPETGFVFKSKDERVVSGRVEVDSSKRVPVPVGDVRVLTEEEVEKVKSEGFDLDSKYTTTNAKAPENESSADEDDFFNDEE